MLKVFYRYPGNISSWSTLNLLKSSRYSSTNYRANLRLQSEIHAIASFSSKSDRRRLDVKRLFLNPEEKNVSKSILQQKLNRNSFIPLTKHQHRRLKSSKKTNPKLLSLSSVNIECPLNDLIQTFSTVDRTNNVVETNTIEDLLNVLKRTVSPSEFIVNLEKMCESPLSKMMLMMNVSGNESFNLQEIEAYLLNFFKKFNDNNLVTIIRFLKKFHPQDDHVTVQLLNPMLNRLPNLSIQQIVRLIEELRSEREKHHWMKQIYQCLLSLAEKRHFEFENIQDILIVSRRLPTNDRLSNLLDERILNITDQLSVDDWLKILNNKSTLKGRDRMIIRAASYNLLKLTESILLPLEKIKDCLSVCTKSNMHDKTLLERLTRTAYQQIHQINDFSILPSLVTSIGTLRLRHCGLLNAIGQILEKHFKNPSMNTSASIQSFVRTCASLNYLPIPLIKLIENHQEILGFISRQDGTQQITIKNRIDFVWALTILNQENESHFDSIFNTETYRFVQDEILQSKISNALKILSLYAHGSQKFSRKFLSPTFHDVQLIEHFNLKSEAQYQLAKVVNQFATENIFSKFNVFTSNLINIDCYLIVNEVGEPQVLSQDVLFDKTNRLQPIDTIQRKNTFKIALKCLNHQDKTLLTNAISGSVSFRMRLLNSLGFRCVPIEYEELMKIQNLDDRVKFVQRSIKEVLRSASTLLE